MTRRPSSALARQIRAWMRAHQGDHADPITGEIDCTAITEAAASEFEINHLGGPLDDPGGWLWDLAVDLPPQAHH